MTTARSSWVAALIVVPAICAAPAQPAEAPGAAILDIDAAAARLHPDLPDRRGWARDVIAALAKIDRTATAADVCATFAVIDVTTGFDAEVRLDRFAPFDFTAALEEKYGVALAGLIRLALRLPDASGDTFEQRFAEAETERQVDTAFLDLLSTLQERAPSLYALADRSLRSRYGIALIDLDPIRTLGPMQVNLRWAERHAGGDVPIAVLRQRLHTRAGGIEAGVARLLGGEPRYDDIRFLFADYNAGEFSSRNAAFQDLVARLTGAPLALDGDLLNYGPDDAPLADSESLRLLVRLGPELDPPLDQESIRRDLQLEKRRAFEETATWLEVRALAGRRLGAQFADAQVPLISARGAKQKTWFPVRAWARTAQRTFDRCLAGRPVPVRLRTKVVEKAQEGPGA